MNNIQDSPFYVMLKIISWPFKSFFRILIVVIIVGLYIYQAVTIDEFAREIRMLEVKHKQLENNKANLEIQIEQLTNINRIEKLAKEKFGLINAGNHIENLVIKKFEKKPQSTETEMIQLAGVK
jgi:cell division protein FtsL